MKRLIDAPIAQLVRDLESRELLDRTLIVVASEFSRDVMIEGKPDKRVKDQVAQPDVIDGTEDITACTAISPGRQRAPLRRRREAGALYGKTADESPCTTIEKPLTVTDLHATIYRAMGLSPRYGLETERRPFHVTQDGVGKPALELFA